MTYFHCPDSGQNLASELPNIPFWCFQAYHPRLLVKYVQYHRKPCKTPYSETMLSHPQQPYQCPHQKLRSMKTSTPRPPKHAQKNNLNNSKIKPPQTTKASRPNAYPNISIESPRHAAPSCFVPPPGLPHPPDFVFFSSLAVWRLTDPDFTYRRLELVSLLDRAFGLASLGGFGACEALVGFSLLGCLWGWLGGGEGVC